MRARLVAIQVGRPRPQVAKEKEGGETWVSGYGKERVDGEVFVGRLNLDGDGQADKRWHGGPDMAVLAYANAHYARWRAELAWPAAGPGAFAENFTVDDVDEQSACLGDVWQVGEARLQISEPRKPCRNISRFWGREDLLRLTEQSGRFGWYLRVLREGRVRAGQEIELIERPHPEWTVARAMAARRTKARDQAPAQRLAACPALGAAWRDKLLE
jgi:MOSC domain-containing protein YiiM